MTLLLAFALLRQDAIDELVQRLERDDIAEREDAMQKLIERGEEVRPRIEKLATSDNLEVAGRVRAILEALDQRKVLAAAFGEKRTYDLHVADEPVVDVLKKFRTDTKFPLKLRDVPLDARVTIDVKGATAFEAISRLCEASGKVRFDAASGTVEGGTPCAFPLAFKDRWGLYLTSVSIHNAVAGVGGGYSYANAGFAAVWDTPKAPSAVNIEATEVVTDGGDNVAISQQERYYGWGERPNDAARGQSKNENFNPPDAAVKSLTFRGTAHFEYDIEEGVIKVENPSKAAGSNQQTELGDFRLTQFTGGEGTFRVYVNFTSPAGALTPSVTRRRGLTIRLVDSDGKTYNGRIDSSSHGGGGNGTESWGYGANIEVPPEKTVQRLEILFPKRTHTVDVPFEFKNVPIK